jgi:putative two-component system response regulator
MPLAKLVTSCPELTDQLSGCLGEGYDIECFDCFDDQISLMDHVVILGYDQVNAIGREVVESEILRYESAGVSVFLAWSDAAEDFRALAMELGCSDYLAPPFIESVVNSKCKTHISLANLKRDFADNATNSLSDTAAGSASGFVEAKELLAVQDAAILCLATIARVRDHSTGNHILRTQHYVKALAEHLRKSAEYGEELDSETIELFYKTSALHDIGKVGIPDSILQKPGALMPDEYEVMKTHTYLGYQAVHSAAQLLERESSGQAAKFLKIAQQVTLSHHERWDGKGYPQGLEGKNIPLVARLMAVADVYDAMISRRPYKNAMDHSYVTQVISRGRGSHFDPTVVDAFLDLQDMFDRISIKLEDVFPSSVDMTLHSIADLIDENDVVSSPAG